MKIKEIIDICDGKLVCGNIDLDINSFCKDTRRINKGDLYLGIKGDSFDGNIFYKEAFSNGAIACILDNEDVIDNIDKNMTIILVDDTVEALAKLAKYKRSLYDIPVVAITGSVGKTSVKDIVYHVMKSEYNVLCTKGNLNNHIGLPLTILELQDHDALVVEMGMNHFNEIHELSNIAKPSLAIITNIGTAHIGNLGSRENILKAKLEILGGLSNDGMLIINNDNDLLHTLDYDNMITIGIDNESDYMATDICEEAFSSSFYVDGEYITIPVGSRAFIYNALFAYAVGRKLGIKSDKIKSSLSNFKLSPHRLEIVEGKNKTIIDDTYNASLDSVRNSLALLSKVEGRQVFIFADILEVDNFGEDIHKDVGYACCDSNIDVVICVGEMAKYTYEVTNENDIESYFFNNNSELIDEIDNILMDDDTILIKGSHSMNLLEVVDYLRK